MYEQGNLTLTIPYVLQKKFLVKSFTDHTPLTWIKHTSGKGLVSQFKFDTLSVIDFEMDYVKGNDTVANSSRFPMLGPSRPRLTNTGRSKLKILLSRQWCRTTFKKNIPFACFAANDLVQPPNCNRQPMENVETNTRPARKGSQNSPVNTRFNMDSPRVELRRKLDHSHRMWAKEKNLMEK